MIDDLNSLLPPPGGVQLTDTLVLVRPGAPQLYGVSASVVVPATPSGLASLIAGAGVSGHIALMFDGAGQVVPANPAAAGYAFVGVSTQAAAAGQPVLVAAAGQQIVEPTWSWSPGAALFVSAAGAMTQTPPATGVVQQIGVATTATSMLVQPFPPITLV